MRHQRFIPIALLSIAAAGCSQDSKSPDPAATSGDAPAAAVSHTGKVIEVLMVTDEKGNYYGPDVIEAKRGDLVRFTLKSGVHNVNFVPDSNKVRGGLPTGPSEMLQLPGQTFDYVVAAGPGSYYFHCDPHALLGMVGKLIVAE